MNQDTTKFASLPAPGMAPYARVRRGGAQLGRELVARDYGLVYGGGNVGLMTVIADTVLELHGHVTGVIPKSLVGKKSPTGLVRSACGRSMHERKALMAELSDGFIAMPGGIGTMEELFEVLSWAQLGLHDKPCGLLNVAGYYDPLIAVSRSASAQDFIKPKHRELLIADSDPGRLLDLFAELI